MREAPHFSFLPDLQMPLRDALRGVASLADATEEALEPAARILPDPIRARFRSALRAIEDAGRRLIGAPIDPGHILTAADFVAGRKEDRAARETCATVMGYAWEHLHQVGLDHRQLLSETILVSRLTRGTAPATAPSAAAHAAGLVASIRNSPAIGRIPGVTGAGGAKERDAVDLGLVAIVVWLLAPRGDSMPEEEKLLDLALALVTALRDDMLGALGDPGGLAEALESAAAHL